VRRLDPDQTGPPPGGKVGPPDHRPDLRYDQRACESLADERALRLGIPRVNLLTAPEDMMEEFLQAENRLLDDLKNKRPIAGLGEELTINDVAGVKVILEEEDSGN